MFLIILFRLDEERVLLSTDLSLHYFRQFLRLLSASLMAMAESYVRHSVFPLEEDKRTEFKAHRCLSARDLSDKAFSPGRDGLYKKWTYRRRAVSASLCGLLNTGQGGTLYLGVTDSGRVEGLHMTIYQKVKGRPPTTL